MHGLIKCKTPSVRSVRTEYQYPDASLQFSMIHYKVVKFLLVNIIEFTALLLILKFLEFLNKKFSRFLNFCISFNTFSFSVSRKKMY